MTRRGEIFIDYTKQKYGQLIHQVKVPGFFFQLEEGGESQL